MYVPAHFAMTPEQVASVLASGPAGDLVTSGPSGLEATYVPMLHKAADDGPGVLVGHLSRVNDQWRHAASGGCEALFLCHGPDAYVEADWLSTPEAGSVPTWNYVTVHVWGELVVHDDPDWTLSAARRLSAAHGDDSVDSLPDAEVAKLLRAVVGVELRISRVAGKAKMSQNKTPQVVRRVIEGLRGAGEQDSADWMSENSLPRALAKADLLAGLRERRS
jgi:transcriptional regulator